MTMSSALVSAPAKSISKSNSKSTGITKSQVQAMLAEAANANQIRDAMRRSAQNEHSREVYVVRAHLQLLFQSVLGLCDPSDADGMHKLYHQAGAKAMQMGMELELTNYAAPSPATTTSLEYDEAQAESDGESPPPPAADATKPKSKSKVDRSHLKGKRTGWNLFRSDITAQTAKNGPHPDLIQHDRDLTDEQKAEMKSVPVKGKPGEFKQKPVHPMYTKDNFSKLTDAGIIFAWSTLTKAQRDAYDEKAADEWRTLVKARENAANCPPSGSKDGMEIEGLDESLEEGALPAPVAVPDPDSDDDAPPPPPTSKPKSKSKRPVEEPPAEEEEAEREAAFEAEREAAQAAQAAAESEQESEQEEEQEEAQEEAQEEEPPVTPPRARKSARKAAKPTEPAAPRKSTRKSARTEPTVEELFDEDD